MDKLTIATGGYAARTAKHGIRIIVWSLAWAATMIFADKAELYGWFTSEWMTLLAIAANFGAGVGVVLAYMKSLKDQDELQRSIQLNALALGVGVGLVGGFTYSLLVTTGYIMDEEVTDMILLILGTYMAGVAIGQIRYR